MKSNISICSFIDCGFYVIPEESSPNLVSQRFSSVFSPRRLTVLGFTFRSTIHFELIFSCRCKVRIKSSHFFFIWILSCFSIIRWNTIISSMNSLCISVDMHICRKICFLPISHMCLSRIFQAMLEIFIRVCHSCLKLKISIDHPPLRWISIFFLTYLSIICIYCVVFVSVYSHLWCFAVSLFHHCYFSIFSTLIIFFLTKPINLFPPWFWCLFLSIPIYHYNR